MVAISVDPAAKSVELKQSLGITAFDLYTDEGGAASRAWSVWDAETEIALAASFVVEPGGKVVFRYIGADKTDRPSVDTILAAVSTAPPAADH